MFNSDEEMRRYADTYHAELKRLMKENEEKRQKIEQWEKDKGLKPPREQFINDLHGLPKSDNEIHALAKEKADRKLEEQRKLDKLNLQGEQENERVKTNFMNDFFKGAFNEKELKKASIEAEQERERLRKEQELKQNRGGRTRGM